MSSSKKKPHTKKAQKQESATVQRQNVTATQPVAAQSTAGDTPVAEKPVAGRAGPLAGILKVPSAPVLVLLGILAVGLVIRLLPLVYALKDGHIIFSEYDAYYHLRRITYVVANFPSVSIFDSYVNYPQGFFIGWPPLYDLTAGLLSLIVGLGHPGQAVIELVSSLMNLTIGLLGIVAAYYLTKDIFNEKVALLGAFVMAILPATASVTFFNDVDHHSLEMLVSLGMYLFFLRSVTAGKAQGMGFSGFMSKKEPVVYAALAGVAMAAAIYAWDGAPFYIGIMAIIAFIFYVIDAYRGESSEYLTVTGIIASLVALVLVAPVAATSYYGQRMEIAALYLSWFHIIMLAAVAGFFVFMGLLAGGSKKLKAPWYASPAAAVVVAAVALLATRELLPQVFANLEAGMNFLSGGSAVLSSISQVEPLFSSGGKFSLMPAWSYYGTSLLIAVPALAYFAFRGKARTGAGRIFFLSWTVVVIIMNLLQSRFVYLAGINVAILAGYGIFLMAEFAGLEKLLKRYSENSKVKSPKEKKRIRVPAGLIGVAVLSALLLVQPLFYTYVLGTSPMVDVASWNDAAYWMKSNTPVTSDVYSADIGTMPEYGVMTWWDYGNFILYGAERPAISNNFQTGIEDSANFFIAQNESAADAIMEKDKARYVAVDLRMGLSTIGIADGIFENIPTLAGDNVTTYFTSYRRLDPASSGTVRYLEGTDKYYNSMYSRLYNDLGMGGRDTLGNLTNGLQHYRLTYVNEASDPVFVFEKVKGATVTGKAEPGSKVTLKLNVTVNAAEWTYVSRATADQAGTYSFTVPYVTGVTSGIVQTAPHYVITSGDATTDVGVSADAVQNGKTVEAGGL